MNELAISISKDLESPLVLLLNNGVVYSKGVKLNNCFLGRSGEAMQLLSVPMPDNLLVEKIYSGKNTAYVITQSKQVVVWGANYYGEAGCGEDDFKIEIPQLVPELQDIEELAIGLFHAVARDSKGNVFITGSNAAHQQGRAGQNNYFFTELKIPPPHNAKRIYAGDYNTFILMEDNSLWACGDNLCCRLGIKATESTTQLTHVPLPQGVRVKEICVTAFYTILLDTTGKVYRCGSKMGWLGNELITSFQPITTIHNIIDIQAKSNAVLALTADHKVFEYSAKQYSESVKPSKLFANSTYKFAFNWGQKILEFAHCSEKINHDGLMCCDFEPVASITFAKAIYVGMEGFCFIQENNKCVIDGKLLLGDEITDKLSSYHESLMPNKAIQRYGFFDVDIKVDNANENISNNTVDKRKFSNLYSN